MKRTMPPRQLRTSISCLKVPLNSPSFRWKMKTCLIKRWYDFYFIIPFGSLFYCSRPLHCVFKQLDRDNEFSSTMECLLNTSSFFKHDFHLRIDLFFCLNATMPTPCGESWHNERWLKLSTPRDEELFPHEWKTVRYCYHLSLSICLSHTACGLGPWVRCTKVLVQGVCVSW